MARMKALLLQLPLMNRSFVILSSGRSGSTLLRLLLNCHPGICQLGEILNREELDRFKLRGYSRSGLIDYILARLLPAKPWLPYTGFKVFHEQLEFCSLPLGDVLKALYNPPVVVLYRENLLETFVSLKIAFLTDVWYSDDKTNDCSIEVDWEEFQEFADGEKRRWRNNMTFLSNYKRIMFISFEELITRQTETVTMVFEFLNVECYEATISSKRQNPLPLDIKVSNYKEISERIASLNYDIRLTSNWLQECMK